MQILLIQEKVEVREMLTFPLESALSATCVTAPNGTEARELSAIRNYIPEVVVADNFEEILKFSTDNTLVPEFSFMLCVQAEQAAPAALPGKKFLGYALYADLGANILRILKKEFQTPLPDPNVPLSYTRISTPLLLKMNPLSADVYIRLSGTHYVKLFQKDDHFGEDDLQKYQVKKKLDYLHVRQDECRTIALKLVEEIKKLLPLAAPGEKTSANALAEMVTTIHDLIAEVGVTAEIQEAVKGSVQVALKSMGEFPELAQVLKTVSDSNGKYIGRHTMLLTNIACAMAVCMEWYSDATFEKLTMAAFMHDAALTDHELCAVKDLGEFEKLHKGKFTLAQIQEYKGHPERAVLLLGHFKEVPPEVDKVIAQHHEHPMGSGFPNSLSSNYISPLSSLFIIAHDLTDYILDNEKNFDVDQFLSANENKYSSAHFKKIAKVLSETDFLPEAAKS
jgi:hypothetical protein